ncbi:MAG: hypothetical protein RIT45_2919 [Pseudomonadota bacterium]|jgi:hypothetical protein
MSLLGLGADLDRLPLAAALDMWASAPSGLGAEPDRQLALVERLCTRVRRGDEATPGERAGWLTRALLLRGATGLAEPATRLLAKTVRDVVDLLPAEAFDDVAGAVNGDDEPLAVLLLDAALHRARRDAAGRVALREATLARVATDGERWREHAVHPIRDVLVDTLCTLDLLAGDAEPAWALAEAWPPGRHALREVALSLATAHRQGALQRLLGRYAVGGGLRNSVVDALWEDAERRRDDSLAAWIAAFAPAPDALARVRRCTPAALWPRRRDALLEAMLETGADDLVHACAAEPDAADALDALVLAAGRQPRVAVAAFDALVAVAPERGLRRATQRLRDAMRTRLTSRRELGRLQGELTRAATACGEPALADGVLALLAREVGAAG